MSDGRDRSRWRLPARVGIAAARGDPAGESPTEGIDANMSSNRQGPTRPGTGKALASALSLLLGLLLLPAASGCSRVPKPAQAGLEQAEASLAESGPFAPVSEVPTGPTLALQSVTREGLTVEFSLTPVRAGARDSTTIREGEDVRFRFKVTDGNGAPLSRVNPAAWLDREDESRGSDPSAASRKVQKFLSGGLLARADLDLNVYHVLALNDDPSISVVDPLFGFGGTKLLALVKLDAAGADWAIAADQRRVFVALPEAHQVAMVDTSTWEIGARTAVAGHPARIVVQPDGGRLWVACAAAGNARGGVRALAQQGTEVVAEIATGPGPYDLAVSDDSSWVFATAAAAGTTSVIEARSARLRDTLRTGERPVSVAYSPLARMAYVAHEDGTIAVIDPLRRSVVAGMTVQPGLGPIRFAPGGRYALAINPRAKTAYVIDAALNRIVQTCDTREGCDGIAFSDQFAYIRHGDCEVVRIIPLKQLGTAGAPLSVVEFFGGQNPPGGRAASGAADAIVQAPGESAVLVANPADRAIYYYKEGLVAPMGHFSNYGHRPHSVLCVDRSLRERASTGVYVTVAKLPAAGRYDVLVYLNAPRFVHAFHLDVKPDPERQRERDAKKVTVTFLGKPPQLKIGQPTTLRFRIVGAGDDRPRTGLRDVEVLAFLAPGIWHKRHSAREQGGGVYEIDFTPPRPGVFYVSLESSSAQLGPKDVRPIILRCDENPPPPAKDADGGHAGEPADEASGSID
jgi:DNA-binding beta-propeller fold protein YncE